MPAGLKGVRGSAGRRGPGGRPGVMGDQGDQGVDGLKGKNCFGGHFWKRICPLNVSNRNSVFRPLLQSEPNSVSLGVPGPKGSLGAKGAPGRPGPCGNPPDTNGFMFTRHSQNLLVPECPAGSAELYSGYSLLFINGNNRAHGQDLGN